jgi:hypothetical protein
MRKLLISLIISTALSANASITDRSSANELAYFLKSKKVEVLEIARQMHEYTYYAFAIDAKNCVAKKSPIGAVGMCMVMGLASEENAIAYYSINVSSDYFGTGNEKRKISLTLIDYEI